MNIKLLDSWLRDYLKTSAKPKEIAQNLSLTSVSIERLEKYGTDFAYDIEVTTNRPDLMSVVGLAREAGAVLPQSGITAKFEEPKIEAVRINQKLEVEIKNDATLVNRICAVALEVTLGQSPEKIKERLETSGIRSLNNVIDVTNYVMREIGHPIHVFDLDRLTTKKLIIRESKKGEKMTTLDGKTYELPGGDIVADNGEDEIVDLLGIMGTQNSVVEETTKRVLLFIDNNDPVRIRKTSMALALRTEAAALNEKGVDPELAYPAILRGVELLAEIADGKVISEVVDIYPNKPKAKTVTTTEEKINSVIGVKIPLKASVKILGDLGFEVGISNSKLTAKVPSFRLNDIEIEEDLIEEIARVYGYHRIPSELPQIEAVNFYSPQNDRFYWEKRIKDALKYFGFTEIYTYSSVSADLFEGPLDDAVVIKNPLSEENVYMRRTLVPSLLEAVRENKNRENLKLFELANVYIKRKGDLPEEKMKLAGAYKKPKASFFEIKGILESLLSDLGVEEYAFKAAKDTFGADVFIKDKALGSVEILDENLIDFELDLETLLKHVRLEKKYTPISKFPQSIEDLRFEIDPEIPYKKIAGTIKKQNELIREVSLLDVYRNKKTFRIVYQSFERNLTNEEIAEVRKKIIDALKKDFKAEQI